MAERKFTKEFKFEAVKLVTKRGGQNINKHMPHPISGHPTSNTTMPFKASHFNRGDQSSDCGKSRSA